MSEKAKRKSNPRRRTLIRLILGIGLAVALISAGIYALRPKSAQIVFIAPDDNGVDNIWIADVTNPEHPRQLTFYTYSRVSGDLQLSDDGNFILFSMTSSDRGYIWNIVLFNIQRNEFDYIMECSIYSRSKCRGHSLSPDGRYIAYEETSVSDLDDDLTSLMIYDAQTQVHQRIFYQVDSYNQFGCAICQQWIGADSLLVFRPYQDIEKLIFYDVKRHRITEIASYDLGIGGFYFSPDGTHYAYYEYEMQSSLYSITQEREDRVEVMLRYRMWDGEASSGNTLGQEWHPNHEYVLIDDHFSSNSELNLYNVTTGEVETISSRVYYDSFSSPSFNYDGSRILYSIFLQNPRRNHQIMLFDMESREEIALPLFGYSPQWVNEGR